MSANSSLEDGGIKKIDRWITTSEHILMIKHIWIANKFKYKIKILEFDFCKLQLGKYFFIDINLSNQSINQPTQ